MNKIYLMLFAFLCMAGVNAQELLRPADLVNHISAKKQAEKVSLFKKATAQNPQLDAVLDDYVEVEFDLNAKRQLQKGDSNFVEIDLPISKHETITLQLVKTDLFDENDVIRTYPADKLVEVEVGTHYRGIVKGKPETLVAFSIFKDEVMGLAAGLYDSNLVIGKVEGKKNHVVYLDQQIAKHNDFECGVVDDHIAYKEEEITMEEGTEERAASKCIRFYIEVNYDIYRNKGSENATSNFVTGLMNQVMTLYANENINTKLMPIAVWTQPSPYNASGTLDLMRQFQNYRTNWEGDLAQLLGFSGGGGIAAGFSGVCNYDRRQSMSYSGINSSYYTVPTYSWTVNVVTHEYGHIMGSRHTHACVWNGNGTAIDGCAGFVEGNCYQPGYPSGGGTIMSYCHQTSVGMNLAKGFGTQPGNVIRNRVANGSCLGSCSDNPDPDPDPDPEDCDYNEINVRVKTDSYPGETSWFIYDENGRAIASGGNYRAANTTYNESVCLPDGCYTFEIKDSEGDGICCGYGNGSYSVTYNNEVLAEGGQFRASQSTDFCVNDEANPDPEPSCLDVSVVFKTDGYAAETSWNLVDENNRVIAGGSNLDYCNYEYVVNGCIEPGCYTLTFYDSYGDGFCCSYGNGYFQFYEGNRLLLNQWANFGRSVSYQVCIGNGSSQTEQEIILKSEIPPFTTEFNVVSPFKETLNVKFSRTKESITINNMVVSDINGRQVYAQEHVPTDELLSINSTTWAPGVYIITFNNDGQKESIKVIKK
ncbi:T9SS type A sorting domain-containing protein [Flavobacteriaceae bacterium Ap0902]|nr:T9SS type A sorting domain-containing protein [Flavobacteriaceae bacterium Ap0902]